MRLWLWLCSSFPATLFPRKTLFDHVNVFSFSFFFLLLFLLYLVTYLGFWKGKNKHPKSPCNVAVDVSPLLPSFWFCFFIFASTVSQVLFLLIRLLLRVSGNFTFLGVQLPFSPSLFSYYINTPTPRRLRNTHTPVSLSINNRHALLFYL